MKLLPIYSDQISTDSLSVAELPHKPAVPTDREWLSMYPEETREMLREKLEELEPEAEELRNQIKMDFTKAAKHPHDINVWLMHDYATEQGLVPRLMELEKQIKRFKWLLRPANHSRNAISDSDIDYARQMSLETLMGLQFKPAGAGKLKASCPFHHDRSPSLIVFPDNHYHCFSCGKHGSSIDYLMETENISFIEAVKVLRGTP